MITLQKKHKNILLCLPALLVLFSALFLMLPVQAAAGGLGDAKKAGHVGEKPDGYLGIVSGGAPADVRNLVNSINGKRRNAYKSIAKKNNQGLSVVERLAGQKLVQGTKGGNYYMNQGGSWVKK